ncbi:hypothetical protein QQ045_032878 [Rhodiola kirilowii]
MGRRFPLKNHISSEELLFLAFMCLATTVTLAVISALCGSRFRKKTTSDKTDQQPDQTEQKSDTITCAPNQPHPSLLSDDRPSDDALPPPPARRQLDIAGSQSMKPKSNFSITESNKLSSMSMKVGRSLSMSMRWSKKDVTSASAAVATSSSSSEQKKLKAKLEKEDSIWMKTIILGEKCRVEDEDDAVIFDDRGIKVTAYHPKTPSSLPVSRTASYIDQDAIPPRPSNVSNHLN